jgi:hypothetical protein
MDPSDQFRQMARECLALAQKTVDPSTRVNLLTMAQRWFTRANGSPSEGTLNSALRDFNDGQMSRF